MNKAETSNKKQRDFCVNLHRKTKRWYFENFNIRDISTNTKLRKTIKLYYLAINS